MRIFQLNTVCGIKSTGRIAAEIGKLVEAEGGVCRIGTGANPMPPAILPMAYKTLTVPHRKLYTLMIRYLDADGFFNRMGTRRLIREMERFQPDVVHLHNLHGGYLHVETLFRYLKKKNLPVVWTLHDCWPFTGHCAYFDYSGCTRWLTTCHDCPQKTSYPICFGLDQSRRNHQRKRKAFAGLSNLTMVTPCRWLQEHLSRSHMGHYPTQVIYNGVDLTAFAPTPSDIRQRHGLSDGQLILSVAAEWDERKGLRYLTEAAAKLGPDYHFVVIGLSPEQIASLPENMLGIQHTANVQELAQWYTAADCFAFPSMEDNMPMVNLEALACGTPIAGFRTGGAPEAIDPATGIMVDKADVDALCDAIRTLGPKTPQRVEACLQRAQRFDAKRTFEDYLDLYREVAKA